MSHSPIDFLKHIRDEAAYITNNTGGVAEDDFLNDDTLKRAVVRSLEIIGEAVKKISKEFKNKHPEVEWKQMAGMRDRLIHDYMGVDYWIVWDVVSTKIPLLMEVVEKIIASED